tara:strand:- start:766 stop:2772 length:2007 start_codon:yes stop_codon:yes gene_type:complete
MKGDKKNGNIRERDSNTSKSNKKKYGLRSKSSLKEEQKYSKKTSQSSSNSSSSEEEDDDFDQAEFGKFISKLFPSKYINERVDELIKEREQDEDENSENIKYSRRKIKTSLKRKNKCESEDISTNTEDDSEDEDEEYDSDGEMYGTIYSKKKAFNILVSLDDPTRYYENDEDDEDEDDDYDDDEESEEETKKKIEYNEIDTEVLDKLAKIANKMKDKYSESGLLTEIVEFGNKKREDITKYNTQKSKKQTKSNTKKFTKLLRDKKRYTDNTYFKNLSNDEQESLISTLNTIKEYNDDDVPLRISLLKTDIPVKYKSAALRKINTLEFMEPGSNEYYKLKQWVDTFMRIPFNKYSNLPITIEDGVEKCHEFMANSKKILDEAVFGISDAKMQIIQMVGQWLINPSAIGTAIAIKGPMGTGKTTLVKDGISKILGREFAFIALGGATDSSVLEGHSYTYEGSTWGKIVDILVQCKTMNPVIYFDELDKISNTPKGEEIASILTHLTDTSQNDKFHDKYFSEIELDLSRCMFIFSYNEEEKVNPILKDRMYRISTKGYSVKEKKTILEDYLLPKIRSEIKFDKEEVTIPESVLGYIIQKYTQDEEGVRNLKRCIETIYRKLNLFKLMKPGENIFKEEINLEVKFPIILTNEIVDKIIKLDDSNKIPVSLYM